MKEHSGTYKVIIWKVIIWLESDTSSFVIHVEALSLRHIHEQIQAWVQQGYVYNANSDVYIPWHRIRKFAIQPGEK
jgi:hypothetical protein